MMAARRRAFASGSGIPIFAATVISRLSLEKRAERFLSCAPFRYMMFLNLLCPAMASSCTRAKAGVQHRKASGPRAYAGERLCLSQPQRLAIGLQDRVLLLTGVGLHLPQA